MPAPAAQAAPHAGGSLDTAEVPLIVLPHALAAPASPSAREVEALHLDEDNEDEREADGGDAQARQARPRRERHDTPSPPPEAHTGTSTTAAVPAAPALTATMSLQEQLRIVDAELVRERKLLLRLHMLREQRAAARRLKAGQGSPAN
jgi:hypothetical protein